MALADLLARLERRAVTPDTPCSSTGVTAKPLQHKPCTLVTPVTPATCNNRSDAPKVGAGRTAVPFDSEAFEERAAIAEFDGGLSREEAEALAWREDDRRRCGECQHLSARVCTIAKPGGIVSAMSGYQPVDLPHRCAGFLFKQGVCR